MLEVHLYGQLRRFAQNQSPDADSVVWLSLEGGETISDVIDCIGISPEELGRNIFLNGTLSALSRRVSDGDRLALFPRDMSLLYRQYFEVYE